jgi:hypothetical protein
LKSAALGVVEGFTPLGILAHLISVAMEPLEPALKAVLVPLEIVARVIGSAVIPVLRILFPIIKAVAIGFTVVGEVFARISAFILRAVGSLVRGLGRLINKLPGSPGDPLVKAGQALLDLADAQTKTANDLAKARNEIRDLSFDDAMASVNGLSKAAKDASQNIPQIFKMASAVFRAASPFTDGTLPPRTPLNPPDTNGAFGGGGTGEPARPGQTPQPVYQITIVGTNKTARQLFDEVEAEAERRRLAATGTASADSF